MSANWDPGPKDNNVAETEAAAAADAENAKDTVHINSQHFNVRQFQFCITFSYGNHNVYRPLQHMHQLQANVTSSVKTAP